MTSTTTPRSPRRRPTTNQPPADMTTPQQHQQQSPSVPRRRFPSNPAFGAPPRFKDPLPRLTLVESYYAAPNANNVSSTRSTTTEPASSGSPLPVSVPTRTRYVPHPPAPRPTPRFFHLAPWPQYHQSFPTIDAASLSSLHPRAFQYYRPNTVYDLRPETVATMVPSYPTGYPNVNGSNGTAAAATSPDRGDTGGRCQPSPDGSWNTSPSPVTDMMSGGEYAGDDDSRQWDDTDEVLSVTRDGSSRSTSVGGASTSRRTLDDDDPEEPYDGGESSEGGHIAEEQRLQDLDPNPRWTEAASKFLLASLPKKKKANTEYYPSVHHQVQFETDGTIEQREEEGLNRLQDGDPSQRPPYPLPVIIACAIEGSPRKRLTLSELYLAMEKRFPYYTTSDRTAWRNSVRHNLSLNNQFIKEPRPITEPGKGYYWTLAKGAPPGNKRIRKRNKKPGKRALAAMKKAEAEQGANAAAENAARPGGARAAGEEEEQEAAAAAGRRSRSTPAAGSGQESTPANETAVLPSTAIPIDPVLLGPQETPTSRSGAGTRASPAVLAITTTAPLAARHQPATLPPSAGSYAAVTGMVGTPVPATSEVGEQFYVPWEAGAVAGSGTGAAATLSAAPSAPASVRTQTIKPRRRRNPTEASRPCPPPPAVPSVFNNTPASIIPSPPAGLSARTGLSASTGPFAMPFSSASSFLQSNSVPVTPAAPTAPAAASTTTNSFHALAAELEKEGIGARPSGGPAVVDGRPAKRKAPASGLGGSVARKRARKAPTRRDESEDEEEDGEDEEEDGDDDDDEEMDDDSDGYPPGGRWTWRQD